MTSERRRKVEELYHKARQWDDTLRAAYLHEAWAVDESCAETSSAGSRR